jgi:hypothetical protein
MGQDGEVMEYDDEKVSHNPPGSFSTAHIYQIFTHLVFYIDSAANAEKNGLQVSHPATEIVERYVIIIYGH